MSSPKLHLCWEKGKQSEKCSDGNGFNPLQWNCDVLCSYYCIRSTIKFNVVCCHIAAGFPVKMADVCFACGSFQKLKCDTIRYDTNETRQYDTMLLYDKFTLKFTLQPWARFYSLGPCPRIKKKDKNASIIFHVSTHWSWLSSRNRLF